jgi:hypothetical protein
MSSVPQKIAEAAPAVTVPAWIVTLAADVAPIINVVVGLLTVATLVLALRLKWREWKNGK